MPQYVGHSLATYYRAKQGRGKAFNYSSVQILSFIRILEYELKWHDHLSAPPLTENFFSIVNIAFVTGFRFACISKTTEGKTNHLTKTIPFRMAIFLIIWIFLNLSDYHVIFLLFGTVSSLNHVIFITKSKQFCSLRHWGCKQFHNLLFQLRLNDFSTS